MTTVTTSEALKNTDPQEPVFVLCARDPLAISAVKHYITIAHQAGVRYEKIQAAQKVVDAMDAWPEKKQVEEL